MFLALALFLGGCTPSAPTTQSTPAPTKSPALTPAELEEAVSVEGIREHLSALQDIADANDGIRAIGEPGYDASARYVHDRLEAAGWDVSYDEFSSPIFHQVGPTVLRVSGPQNVAFRDGTDVRAMLYSGSGRVEAPLFPLDFDVDGVGREGPGCDPSAFDDVPEGAVVLVRPGDCFLRDQVINAAQAGASAAIFSFPEFTPGKGLRRPTLLAPEGIDIPALAATDAVGKALGGTGRINVTVSVRAETPTRTLRNVIAESPGGDALDIVMAGGHLDSVIDGPGINDNGSGVSTLLEIAEEISMSQPENKIRLAFWAGEEYGLLGSRHYVDELTSLERSDIAVYLNFDMVASPNYVPLVYDNTGAPEGSELVTDLFMKYFSAHGSEGQKIDLVGRSDHYAFEQSGIPVGGLFSGAEEIKTDAQAAQFGGEAGQPLDACYHQGCDDLSNINRAGLDELSNAAANVIATLADRSGGIFPTP